MAMLVPVALVACGAGTDPQQADRQDHRDHHDRRKAAAAHPGEKAQERREGTDGRPGRSPRQDRPSTAASPSPSPAASAAGDRGTTTPVGDDTSGDPGGKRPDREPPEPSCVEDPAGDPEASGSDPAHVDLTGGCLRGDGDRVLLAATTAGAVPRGTPDRDTQLSYGFELTPPSGSTLYVYAQAHPGGWDAYLSRGDGRQPLPDPVVSGSQLTLQLPVAALDGARRVSWRMESSWLRSTLLDTSYAFDAAGAGTFSPT